MTTITGVVVELKRFRGSTRALSVAQVTRIRFRLQELSALKGSDTKAAYLIGISQQVFGRIVNGDAAGLYVAERLAAYDRVPLEAILNGIPKGLYLALLDAHAGRWCDPTIAAVCKLRMADESWTQEDWEGKLDDVERALSPLIGAMPRKLA